MVSIYQVNLWLYASTYTEIEYAIRDSRLLVNSREVCTFLPVCQYVRHKRFICVNTLWKYSSGRAASSTWKGNVVVGPETTWS